MQENADELSADVALICDTGLFQDTAPAIVTMLRGLLGEELTIHAANKDLHSGMFGGLAQNPLRILSRILANLHDDQGRVTVPGFYDGVTELPDAIRQQWQNLAFDHAKFLGNVGLSVPAGEQDRTPLEMIWSRPTAEINGIWGGYTGDGFKTVLPAKAHAKVSFRLVGDQDPLRSAIISAIGFRRNCPPIAVSNGRATATARRGSCRLITRRLKPRARP